MDSFYERFQSQKATQLEDNVESLLQSQQHKFDGFVRQATALSHEVENLKSKVTDKETQQPELGQKTIQLQKLLHEEIYPIIANLRALQQNYDEEAAKSRSNFDENHDLWTTTATMEDTNKRIDNQRQRFDSIKALSAQSLRLYHHQNIVLWCHVVLFVLLVAAAMYLYYYVYSISDGECSLSNLPDNPKELFNNDLVDFEKLLPIEEPIAK